MCLSFFFFLFLKSKISFFENSSDFFFFLVLSLGGKIERKYYGWQKRLPVGARRDSREIENYFCHVFHVLIHVITADVLLLV